MSNNTCTQLTSSSTSTNWLSATFSRIALIAIGLFSEFSVGAADCTLRLQYSLIQYYVNGPQTNTVEILVWGPKRWNIIHTSPARIPVNSDGQRVRTASDVANAVKNGAPPRLITIGEHRQTLAHSDNEYFLLTDTTPESSNEEQYSIPKNSVARAAAGTIPNEAGILRFAAFLFSEATGTIPSPGIVQGWEIAGESVSGKLSWIQPLDPTKVPSGVLLFQPSDTTLPTQTITFADRRIVNQCPVFGELTVSNNQLDLRDKSSITKPLVTFKNLTVLDGPLPDPKSKISMAHAGKVYDSRQIAGVMNKYELSAGEMIPSANRKDLMLAAKRIAATTGTVVQDSSPIFFWVRVGMLFLFLSWMAVIITKQIKRKKQPI